MRRRVRQGWACDAAPGAEPDREDGRAGTRRAPARSPPPLGRRRPVLAAQSGEPIDTFFEPKAAEELVARCGLEVAEHIDRDMLHERYFAGRDDGLTPYDAERLLIAAVPR
jgi:hypothetical protein